MEVPVVALAARMTRWSVGGRRSHPFVSLSISLWAVTTGRSASSVCIRVATSVRTSVRPRWYCGAGVGSFVRFTYVHHWNQTRARLSAQRESGAARTRGYLTATAWREAKTSLQLSVMEANVLAAAVLEEACFVLLGFFASAMAVSEEACFVLPGFFASGASTLTTLSSSLASSASLGGAAYDAHSVMERAKIFSRSFASNSLWRMEVSVKNGGSTTALQDVQSRCFFDCARSPAAARRTTSAIGRQIFFLSVAKAILGLKEITECEPSSPARGKSHNKFSQVLVSNGRMTKR